MEPTKGQVMERAEKNHREHCALNCPLSCGPGSTWYDDALAELRKELDNVHHFEAKLDRTGRKSSVTMDGEPLSGVRSFKAETSVYGLTTVTVEFVGVTADVAVDAVGLEDVTAIGADSKSYRAF